MNLIILSNQKVTAYVAVLSKGVSVVPLSAPQWSVEIDGIVSSILSEDGLSVEFVAVAEGTTNINVTLGSLTDTATIAVSAVEVPGAPDQLVISFDTPVTK